MYRKRELRIFERLENLRQTMYRSFYNCKKSKKFSPISSSKFLSRRRIFVSTFFILAVLKLELLVCVCVYQSFATLLCTETLLYLQR